MLTHCLLTEGEWAREKGRESDLIRCCSNAKVFQKGGVAQGEGGCLLACIKYFTVSSAGAASNGPSVHRRRSRVTVGCGRWCGGWSVGGWCGIGESPNKWPGT